MIKIEFHKRLARNFPSVITDILHIFYGDLILAGGSLRSYLNSEPVDDYDLFLFDSDKFDIVKNYLVKYGFRIKFECPEKKLLTLKHRNIKIQIISGLQVNNVENLLDSFDITVCQLATDGLYLFVYNKQVLKDLKNKHINFHKLQYPAATLGRILKYNKKGYILTPDAKIKFIDMIKNNQSEINGSLVYID